MLCEAIGILEKFELHLKKHYTLVLRIKKWEIGGRQNRRKL